jgi:hypothetical protein
MVDRKTLGSPRSAFSEFSLGSALGSLLGPFPRTCHALATGGLDEGFEIITAVVIRDLIVGFYVLDCPDPDHMLDEIDFRIRPA